MDAIFSFFAGYSWQELVGLFFAAGLGVFPGADIFQWLKTKFALEGQKAQVLVMSASVAITVLAMWVTNALTVDMFEFTLENLIAIGTMIYGGSQLAYQRFKESGRY